jgi:hypothetical protein
MEAKEYPGHKIPRQSCTGRESENAGYLPGQVKFAEDSLELGEYVLQSLSQAGPDWSQSNSAWRPDEERRFQIGFQPADMAGHCRLRKMQAAGGFGNLANLGDYEKGLQQNRRYASQIHGDQLYL